ncbi:CoA transferase [Diaphorobacter sp. HDW4A]|uniref:CaiB/BaiF CoA transferase family protein n=1 Tax=Diaphorobacter sp. HDW4A TaxID=2714924 RepID=UPI00140BF4E0|nr:CoA transferase [Diaphorobacter sp. HDW4A]QIL80385.1 CoA transferase [Diaphorobacter sp. HDW4A]
MQLLPGIRVLDLTRVFAGPLSTQVLGDMGADVIKIEHPLRGDDTRDWGIKIGDTETPYYNSVNRNKRSVTLDLKRPEAREILLQLAATSDVVVHNFKGGDAERLGIACDDILKINPKIIYCHISGYDQHGPERARPGYDMVVQGESGLMSLNGEKDTPPLKFGVAVVDMFTGMYTAQLILGALFKRQIDGQPRKLDVALFDCGLLVSAYYGLEALQLGHEPEKYGNAHPSIVPYGVFDAADGKLIITVGNNAQYENFCRKVLERHDLVDDPRFCTNLLRRENRLVLLPMLMEEIRRHPKAWLLERMAAHGIPCGEVLGILEAIRSERVAKAGLLKTLPHPKAGEVHVFAPPLRVDGERLPVRFAPPTLGGHTQEVLAEVLGMNADQLKTLAASGVL